MKRRAQVIVSIFGVAAAFALAVVYWTGERTVLPWSPEADSMDASPEAQNASTPADPVSDLVEIEGDSSFARWHRKNAELARAQYTFGSNGALTYNENPENFTKMFRFSNGAEVGITFRELDGASATKLNIERNAFEIADFNELLELMSEGNWEVLDWADTALSYCATYRTSGLTPEYCNSYEARMHDQLQDVKEYLYEQGDVSANVRKAHELRNSGDDLDRQSARFIYKELWNRGYISGMNGLMATSPPLSSLGYEEQIEEVAYIYVLFAITSAYADGIPTPETIESLDDFSSKLEQWTSEVSNPVRKSAQIRAHEILVQNQDCCFMAAPNGW